MTDYILGHKEDPSENIKQAFKKVAETDMKGLPFLHPHVDINTYDFQIYEDQWVGAVLTPWMLSVFILPGPTQEWPLRKVGSKLGVQFPCGDISFIVGEIEGIGQYLGCSLMSPLGKHTTPEVLADMARLSMEELINEPDPEEDKKESRRFFMLRKEA